jgi:type 1 glutamine amidotransferase
MAFVNSHPHLEFPIPSPNRRPRRPGAPIMMRFAFRFPLLLALAFACLIASARAADDKPIRALLVAGGCCHDYKRQKDLLTEGISARANVEWVIAYDPDDGTKHLNPVYKNDDWAKGFDVVLHDECSADVTDLKIIDRILKPHREGLPAVVVHCGMHCYRSEGWPKKVTPWFEFTGLQTTGHGAQLPIAVKFLDKDNPITKPLEDWTTIKEELYNNITGKLLDTAQPLARGTQTVKGRKGKIGEQDCVTVWTNLYNGKTRVFGTTLGHNNATVDDSRYLDLVTRGLLWSVGKLDTDHLKPAKRVMSEK